MVAKLPAAFALLSPLLLSLKRASLPLLVSSLYSARDRVSSSTVLIPSHNSPTSRYPQHGLPFKKSGKCDVAGSKSPSSSPGLASSPSPPSSHVPCVRVLLARARPRIRARASSPRAAVEDEEEGEDEEEEAKAELVLAFVTRSLAHGRRAVASSLPLSLHFQREVSVVQGPSNEHKALFTTNFMGTISPQSET